MNFHRSEEAHPHGGRARAILLAHPEVRTLMVRNPKTAIIALSLLTVQTGIALSMGRLGFSYWWASVVLAYIVGAFANHCNDVIIHEATHNLILKSRPLNKLVAIVADLPNVLPGAMGFRAYHLKHHAHQGDYHWDADVASRWEARLVGHSAWRKALWLALFPLFQIARPPRLRSVNLLDGWFLCNVLCATTYDVAIVYFSGWPGLVYLVLSMFFSTGLHPVGARWIQEHYTLDGTQETHSYYGPLNRLALNMGYHNEHHDLPSIPWNNLPKLRAMAPEFYDPLQSYKSWTRLLVAFIFDERFTLFSHIERGEDVGASLRGQRPFVDAPAPVLVEAEGT